MSGHQEYKCPKCGFEYESLDAFDCPKCRELAAPARSAIVPRERIMAVEGQLMTAAAEFGRAWGCDQREHPRAYWLELHIQRWNTLARCALAYAECFDDTKSLSQGGKG